MAAYTHRPAHRHSAVQAQEHGYDVELACGELVDNKYICPICLSVMCDAMQTVCGHRFCKSCITRVAGDRPWGRCPVDKTALRRPEQLFNDVAMRREILSLNIKCRNSNKECTWTGELRDSETHLKDCPLESMTCPLGCEKQLLRGQMTMHKEECPKRSIVCGHCKESIVFNKMHKHEVVDCSRYPVSCTLCGQTGVPRGEIAHHMDSTTGSCPQANVVCKFLSVGCHFQDKRKDMVKHYDANTESHLSLLMNQVVKMTVTNDMLRDELCTAKGKLTETSMQIAEHTETMKQLKERTVCGRLLWKLDLSNMQPLPNMVFSPPFYSSCPGYQMRLRLDFRGVSDGEDVYSSVFLVLQKGEFDQDLMFPYNGQVMVNLLPQSSNRNVSNRKVSTVIKCKDIPRNITGNTNARVNSRGCTRFLKQKELLSPVYNKNNVLYFDLSVVNPSENDGNQNSGSVPPASNILVSPLSPVSS
ncbi:TNF receptor-associated factor 6-like [Littorina saxatilis]|uniref:Uncharacterized protein n=1 Tax=Littorina saxatilis TaxID=31220 RepID=A0AAN9BV37_9CAEN